MRRTLCAAVAALVALVALVAPGVSSAAPAPVGTVTWGGCPQGVTAPGLECATV